MTEAPTEPPRKDENVNESVRHQLDFCATRVARQRADFENNPFAEVSFRVEIILTRYPRVASQARQPWAGGRNPFGILKATALGKDLRIAQAAAYAAVESIQFEGAHFRRDIAAKAF